jgi:hypothetical protein
VFGFDNGKYTTSGFGVATREIVKADLSKSSRWVNVSTLKSDLDVWLRLLGPQSQH